MSVLTLKLIVQYNSHIFSYLPFREFFMIVLTEAGGTHQYQPCHGKSGDPATDCLSFNPGLSFSFSHL